MTNIKDDQCLDFVLEKMIGNMLLVGNLTEQDDIKFYKDGKHINYFIPKDNGFLCLTDVVNFVFIPYAWYDGSFSARRAMVRLGKELYQHYTIEQGKLIYYTGLKNFYPNHSKQIEENLWIFTP